MNDDSERIPKEQFLPKLGTILVFVWKDWGNPWKSSSWQVQSVTATPAILLLRFWQRHTIRNVWLLLWMLSIALSFTAVLHKVVCFHNQAHERNGFYSARARAWSLALMLMMKTSSLPEKPQDDDDDWTDSPIY
jgi:hypothetical protein